MTNLIALPSGTELVGDFRIERVLGAGGFGITYLAEESALDRKVTIKEYFPADFAVRRDKGEAVPRSQDSSADYRWGLDRFIEEAQTLAKFSHPNIVRVYRYFRANNTGYMVLHFEEGQSLKAWLKGLGRAPRQKELDAILAPLLDALDLIHKQDFLHRDIAPDNIIIRKDGAPVLIDFGSARGEIAAHSKTVSALVKPGYSPFEQYAETMRQQGPWTDIYALGATLYHAVTGRRPADSPTRMVKDEYVPARDVALAAYRPGFLKAIDHALSLAIENRPQSIAAWRGALLAPEPAKQSWLARGKSAPDAKAEAPAEQAPAAKARAPAANATVPPPPDAPGPKGGMLDFLDGLKKKPAANKAASPAAPVGDAATPAPTAKLDTPPEPIKLPRILRKPDAAPANAQVPAKDAKKAEPAKEKRKPARPHPIRMPSAPRWRPILFKLIVGVGVASAAVAMQDRMPHYESRGAAITTASTKPATATATQREAEPIRPLSELHGHTAPIKSVAYANDGRTLLTTGDDARLIVWNAESGALTRTIELDDGAATSLAVFGDRVLTAHTGGATVLWNWQTAEKIATFKRNEAAIWAITFAGRADRFATASHDWKIAIWDVATTAAPVQVLDAHDNAAQALAYINGPKGPLLATGGADKLVRLWNLDTLDRVRTYRGHKDFVTAIAFSPDGREISAAGLDGTIRIWSSASNRLIRRLYGHRGRVGSLAYTPNGALIVSGGADGQLRIWDKERGRTLRTITGQPGGLNAVGISPEGERIATAGDDGIIRIWQNPATKIAAGQNISD